MPLRRDSHALVSSVAGRYPRPLFRAPFPSPHFRNVGVFSPPSRSTRLLRCKRYPTTMIMQWLPIICACGKQIRPQTTCPLLARCCCCTTYTHAKLSFQIAVVSESIDIVLPKTSGTNLGTPVEIVVLRSVTVAVCMYERQLFLRLVETRAIFSIRMTGATTICPYRPLFARWVPPPRPGSHSPSISSFPCLLLVS